MWLDTMYITHTAFWNWVCFFCVYLFTIMIKLYLPGLIVYSGLLQTWTQITKRIVHLVRTHALPKNQHFLSYNKHTPHTCAYQAVRHVSFSENFAYVLNEWSQTRNCYRFYINSNFVDAEIVKFENFQIWVFQSSKIDLLELVFCKIFSYLDTF